jgi:hypothetical protein
MTVQAIVRSNVTGQRRGIIAQGLLDGTDANSSLLLAYVDATWANGATKAIQFQWRNAVGSNFIVSRSSKQTTSRQIIHATWSAGQVPRLYLDGVEETAPAATGAATDTGVTPNGDLWLGVAPGPLNPASTGWNGLIDEVRIHPTALSAEHVVTEAANQGDPAAFYGLGGEEAMDGPSAAVALPLTATTPAGQRIDIDAAAAAFAPAGSSPATLTAVASPPTNGLATIIGGKLRYTPNAGYAGPDGLTYVLTDTLGRTSAGKVSVTVTQASPLWAGPNSKLPWHSGGWSRLADLRSLRTNPSNGKIRHLDMAELFFPQGSWDRWGAFAASWISDYNGHTETLLANNGASMIIAIRPFSCGVATGNDASTWQSRTLATWPAKGSIAKTAWISARIPVGYSPSITNPDTQKAQAMDVWQHAADGHFDHLWGPGLTEWYDAYIVPNNFQSRRIVLRPFWECDGSWVYGQTHSLYEHSINCARNAADAVIIKAAMQRFADVARESIPGVFLHFNPLRGGGMPAGLRINDFIDPATWDILGPDYYDIDDFGGNTKPASASDPDARAIYEQRWNDQLNQTGANGGLKGLGTWISYIRNTALPINPNIRLGIGEWALWASTGPGSKPNGGDDNFVFIEKMYETFAANADIMAYEIYFNKHPYHHIGPSGSGTPHPMASAAYSAKYATLA